MQAKNLTQSLLELSGPRLATYRNFFAPADDAELYRLYCWNENVAGSFRFLINSVEIAMRNAFHRELSLRYGASAGTPSSDWYNELRLAGKTLDNIRYVTHYCPRGRPPVPLAVPPSPDTVVAKQTFGFWKNLFDVSRTQAGAVVPWADIMPNLLPNHRQRLPGYWTLRRRDAIWARIDLIGNLRNRIAHLEPVWKSGQLYEEARSTGGYVLIIQDPAPATPEAALARLRLLRERGLELLRWLSCARADDYEFSEHNLRLKLYLSEDGLTACRTDRLYQSASLSMIGTKKAAHKLRRSIVNVTEAGRTIATTFPA